LTVQSGLKRRQLRAIVLLPGTVTILVPALIVWLGGADFEALTVVVGAVLIGCGLALVGWTVALFVDEGRGTLAPWDPTSKLVVRGPYRHVRNPMITGVGTILVGEALLFRSWGIATELVVFALVNAVYFPLVEEPGLQQRFGAEYEEYRARVPRWLPRVRL
jgi:protein-S-isoprenylcysteine O-methyltransferase Ste14